MTALRILAIIANLLWVGLVIIGTAWQGSSPAQVSLVLYAVIGALNTHTLRAKTSSLDSVVAVMNGLVAIFCLSLATMGHLSLRRGALIYLAVVLLTLVAISIRNSGWQAGKSLPQSADRRPGKSTRF